MVPPARYVKFTALLLLAALAVGCAPRGGSGISEDVIEIEEIEMAPRPIEESTQVPTADGGEEARREVDAEKAAADKAIDEAAQSIEPPPQEPAPSAGSAERALEQGAPAPEKAAALDEPAVAESPQPEPTAQP